ncbi:MAG TPA: nitrate/nitrite transporter NrtS [Dehalococcoidia bacterium]|nr:nitrate/nitrite transporter NrtS [Dehalococcoidia bacterium]
MSQGIARGTVCTSCDKRTAGFVLADRPRCLWCFLRHRPMLKRSFLTAVVVGTILTAINQGTILADGDFPGALYWKIPLTYCVPFCVATWGALINSRIRAA